MMAGLSLTFTARYEFSPTSTAERFQALTGDHGKRVLKPEFVFVDYAETRLYHLSASYTKDGTKSRIVADEIRAEIERCLPLEHDGKHSLYLNLPGEAAWRTMVLGRVRKKPLYAEITYLVEPTYLNGDYVPVFEVYVVNPKRPLMVGILQAA